MIFSNDTVIESAFNYFRERGFPYRKLPVHMCMQEINKLSELPDESLDTSTLAYQVADTYHPHRFQTRVHGMKSPLEAFYDDKVLQRCLTRMMEHGTGIKESLLGGVGGIAITSGTQAAANFRPAYALKMYRKYCKEGDIVLDTSTGFGGRLLGLMAFGESWHYVGIDPSRRAHRGNLKMAKDLGFSESVSLYDIPVEDLDLEPFRNYCDFAFTSPPYFCKELYEEDDEQSWVRYTTGTEWKEGFLDKMMLFQYSALKENTVSAVNISDVKIKGKEYPLIEWCIDSGMSAGFKLKEVEHFKLQKRIGKGHEFAEDVAKEVVLIFHKA